MKINELLKKINPIINYDYIGIESSAGLVLFTLSEEGLLINVSFDSLEEQYKITKNKNILFFSEDEKVVPYKGNFLFLSPKKARKEALIFTQMASATCVDRKAKRIYAYPMDRIKEYNFNIISGLSVLQNLFLLDNNFNKENAFTASLILETDQNRYMIFNTAFDNGKCYNIELSIGSEDYNFSVEEYKTKLDSLTHYEYFYTEFIKNKSFNSYKNIKLKKEIKVDFKFFEYALLASLIVFTTYYGHKAISDYLSIQKNEKQLKSMKRDTIEFQKQVKEKMDSTLSVLGYMLSIDFNEDFNNAEKMWIDGIKIDFEGSLNSTNYNMKMSLFSSSGRGNAEVTRVSKEEVQKFLDIKEPENCVSNKNISADGTVATINVSCNKENKLLSYIEKK